MQSIKEIKVALDFGSKADPVGRLAIRDNIIYFEYDEEFVQRGLEISPFHLPLKNGLSELPQTPFDGLAGVFGDSLPDGWGRLLFDRIMRAKGILSTDINSLDRLANVGLYGMGALVYEPDNSPSLEDELIDLDQLASQAEQVLEGNSEEVLKQLLVLNGSSAGARPKALIGVDFDRKNISYGAKKLGEGFENWLVKFPNSQDGLDAGAIEYVYALMAKEAGLDIPDVHLFKAKKGRGYFAVKRFDRDGNRRLHMHTVAGLIHTNFRYPSLDYEDLIGLTFALTKDAREVEKMFRMAVFNVFANNRDDHAKNFSFLMDETGEWKLSPAYDLTFSSGPGGEQSMMVMGEGRNIEVKHLIKLGEEAKLSNAIINGIIEQTRFALSYWPYLAKEYGISDSNIELISRAITKL